MTTEEVKAAFMNKTPIIHNDIEYSHISAIIYRKKSKTEIRIQVELADKRAHSVTIAEPSRVRLKEE